MTIKPFNSVDGFSVSENGNLVIDNNGNVSATNLTVSGESNLGNIGNLIITGGSDGYVITTDGSGNLNWTEIAAPTSIINGNSNVSIPTSNGNVNISSAGNANVVVVTGTGANITGTLNVSSTITGANIIGTNGVYSNSGNIKGNSVYGNVIFANSDITSNGAIYPRDTTSSGGNDGILFTGSSPYQSQTAAIRFTPTNQFGARLVITNQTSGTNGDGYVRFTTPNVFIDDGLVVNGLATVNTLSVTGNITGGGTANITGNIRSGNANLGNLATANYLAGTLTTDAQPNITSVGTLTSLTVGPNSSVVLSGTSGYVKANSIQGLDGTNTVYMYYGNIAGAAGIYGDLTIGTSGTGNLVVGNGTAFFGNANTVKIQGGSANYVLTTDGAGNLTWRDSSTVGGSSIISNGTSNVSIASVNGNINMAVAGTGNLIRVSSNGFFANTDIFNLQTRIVQQGGNPNGTQLSSDDGKDRGVILNYYDTFPAQAFMGWDNSNSEIALASEVTVASDVVSIFAFANVRANNFLGNIIGNISGNITSPGSNTEVLYNDGGTIAGAATLTFDKTTNVVNAAGNLNVVGTMSAGNISTSGNLNLTGQANAGNIDSFNFINAVSTITGGNFYSGGTIQTVGNATFANIATGGEIAATGNIAGGNLSTTGGLSVLGNVTIGSLASNLLYVSSNYANFDVERVTVGGAINGTYIYPNGYVQLRNLSVYSVTGDPGTITTSELFVTANANISGNLNVPAAVYTGSISVTGNVSGNIGNFVSNITAANANLGNLVTANFFQGDGYLLSNLTIPAGTAIENGNSNVAVAPNANVTITVTGVANVVTVTSSNVIVNANISTTGNISTTDNIIATGNISANNGTLTGNLNAGVVKNANAVISLYNPANVADAYINIGTSASPSRLQVNNSNVIVNDLLRVIGNANVTTLNATTANVTGNVTSGNANLGNLVSANFFAGDGYLLTNLTLGAGTYIENGNSNVIVLANANVNISSEGNANVLVVSGNSIVANKRLIAGNANITTAIITTANITDLNLFNNFNADGNLYANGWANVTNLRVRDANPGAGGGESTFEGNASFENSLTVTNYANIGTIYAGYIQSHGSIHANANISANGISAAIQLSGANISGTNLSITNATITNGNITTANVSGNLKSGNANLGNLATANFFSGDGYLLTNLTIGAGTFIENGTSNVVVDTDANVRIGVSGTPNVLIVSSGGANLTGNISVSGTANITGNVSVGNISGGIANFTGNANTANLYVSGTLNATGAANTGVLTVNGNITAANASFGNAVSANYFIGDGYLLSNLTIPAGTAIINGNSNVLVTYASDVNITSNGVANVLKITSTGTVTTGNAEVTGYIKAGSFANGTSNITITNNSDIDMYSNGSTVRLKVTDAGANIYGTFTNLGSTTITGNANIANVGVSGLVIVAGNVTGGNLNTGGRLSVGGNANVGNLYASGEITAVTTVTGGRLVADGNANVGLTANVNALIVRSGGAEIVGTTTVTGNLDVTGNMNVTGNLNYQNVTDLVVGDPLIYIGANNTGDALDLGIVASYNDGVYEHTGLARNHINDYWTFFDGVVAEPTTTIDWANATYPTVKLGNLVATSNGNFTGNVHAAYFLGNVVGNISGNITVGSNTQVLFSDDGIIAGNSQLTFNKTTGALTATGNGIFANVSGGNVVTANYFTGTLTTAAQPNVTSLGTLTSLAITGNLTSGNANLGNLASANYISGTLTTVAQPNITSVGTLTSLAITGNLTSGNANLGNLATANYITGTLTTNAQPNVTSLGTLSNLSVGGNLTVGGGTGGNLTGANNITANFFIGNGSQLTGIAGGNVSGQVANALVAGTVYTNAQPNITSVGTLTALTVGPNSSIVLSGTTGFLKANSIQGLDGTSAIFPYYGSVSGAVGIYSDLTVGTSSSGNLIANVGKVVFGNVGDITITGGSNGYVLTTDGAGNLTWGAAGGGGGGTPGGSNTQVQFNDAGSFGGNAGFTFNKTNTTLTANNFIATSSANLGNVGNVRITGGISNYYLKTDGLGNLSWSSVDAGTLSTLTTITVDNFTGNGVQDTFTLSVVPGSIDLTMINIDGVEQLRNAYTLVNQNVIFDSAPANGAEIEVTIFLALASGAGSFSTRNYSGNGVQNTFTVTSGQTSSSLLVTENGLLQVPETDYTVSGANLIFTTPPANGQAIQVREMGVATSTSAASSARALGYSLIFGG